MTSRSKFSHVAAAAFGLLVAGGVVADASAATVVTKTRTVATHAVKPVVVRKTVRIVHRVRRPHLAVTRVIPGRLIAPRIKIAHAVTTKHIVKKTVIR